MITVDELGCESSISKTMFVGAVCDEMIDLMFSFRSWVDPDAINRFSKTGSNGDHVTYG